jgi:hypothetical protein
MLIEFGSDAFQHDQVAILEDSERGRYDIYTQGVHVRTISDASILIQRIRAAEKQEQQQRIYELSRAFRGYEV